MKDDIAKAMQVDHEYLGDALWATMDVKGTVRVFQDKKKGNALIMTSASICALYAYCRRGDSAGWHPAFAAMLEAIDLGLSAKLVSTDAKNVLALLRTDVERIRAKGPQ